MKATVTALALAISSILLTGCITINTGPTSSTSTPQALPSEVATSVFLEVMASRNPTADNHAVLNLGHAICNIFGAGGSWLQAVKGLTDDGTPANDAGYYIATSVTTLCPQYRSKLPSTN